MPEVLPVFRHPAGVWRRSSRILGAGSRAAVRLFRACADGVQDWRLYKKVMTELSLLGPRELADLGLSWQQIPALAAYIATIGDGRNTSVGYRDLIDRFLAEETLFGRPQTTYEQAGVLAAHESFWVVGSGLSLSD